MVESVGPAVRPAREAEGGGGGCYVGWSEVYVCSEKGRREIHYTLTRRDGGSDLAVIAKEKSLRHMTYRFLIDDFAASFYIKPRSRRELVDWLDSFVPDSSIPVSAQTSPGFSYGNDADEVNVQVMKDTQLRRLGQYTTEFLWLGSPWMCKKRRKHYKAFRRNGFKVSVNEFVHVLAEEDKRLVAYLDDMYEDSKGSKMVVVRWFHKIDEVGIDLPHNFNDREIFFSLCLQDLSIECIDGLTTVLSPEHYAKFMSEAKHTQLEPYVCHQQYDNDDLKPLDVTQVKGYWKQDVVRYMSSFPSSRILQRTGLPETSRKSEDNIDFSVTKSRKRLRLSREHQVDMQCALAKDANDSDHIVVRSNSRFAKGPVGAVSRKGMNVEVAPQFIAVGSVVEALSQDSGIRGCWFKAIVVKKHQNKVKLRYLNIKDAENEANFLEEWVLASRVAARDDMGLRRNGRLTVRPSMMSHNAKVSWAINVGSIVDAWQHDGWWEGIVIQEQFDEKLRVYFPGEKRDAVFSRSDLRHSQEWVENTWKALSERPDIAASVLSGLMRVGRAGKSGDDKAPKNLISDVEQLAPDLRKDYSCGARDSSSNFFVDFSYKKESSRVVVDLSKDDSLSHLKWNSSGKRRRSCFSVQKLQPRGRNRVNSERTLFHENNQEFLVPSTVNGEKESCKTAKGDRDDYKLSDSLFSSSVVPPLTSLVMSR